MKLQFEIGPIREETLIAWIKKQDKKYLKQTTGKSKGTPDYGSIGGSLQYIIQPTSIGDIFIVRHTGTNEEINLTDFDEW